MGPKTVKNIFSFYFLFFYSRIPATENDKSCQFARKVGRLCSISRGVLQAAVITKICVMIVMKFKYHSFRCRQGAWAVGALLWKVKQATRSSAPYCHRKSNTDIPKSSILGPSRWVSVDVCIFECSSQRRELCSDIFSKTKFQGLILVWIYVALTI